MDFLNKFVLGMALLRFFSGSLEILAGLIMLKFNDLNKALLVNSTLALIGPLILMITTAVGLVGISDSISFSKLAWIITGVLFIFIGLKG